MAIHEVKERAVSHAWRIIGRPQEGAVQVKYTNAMTPEHFDALRDALEDITHHIPFVTYDLQPKQKQLEIKLPPEQDVSRVLRRLTSNFQNVYEPKLTTAFLPKNDVKAFCEEYVRELGPIGGRALALSAAAGVGSHAARVHTPASKNGCGIG